MSERILLVGVLADDRKAEDRLRKTFKEFDADEYIIEASHRRFAMIDKARQDMQRFILNGDCDPQTASETINDLYALASSPQTAFSYRFARASGNRCRLVGQNDESNIARLCEHALSSIKNGVRWTAAEQEKPPHPPIYNENPDLLTDLRRLCARFTGQYSTDKEIATVAEYALNHTEKIVIITQAKRLAPSRFKTTLAGRLKRYTIRKLFV